ncbi:MAG TPA: EamA family transporter [Lacunisphaera sp.]|nr:EamA family transporter [Lacunisphaera sp.]
MSDRPDARLHHRAVLWLLVANLFWGLSFPLIKALAFAHRQVLPESSNWFITAGTCAPRFLLASIVLVVVLGRRAAACTRGEIRQGVLLGLTAGTGMLFQNDGLQFTAASTSAFLTQLYAIMIPAWLALRSGRRPPARVLWCCGLVLVGVGILGRFDVRALRLGRGEFETLLSSVFFMMQILVLGRRDFAGNRALPVTLAMFATEAVLFTALAVGTAPRPSALLVPWASTPWLGFTALLTVFCTLGSFLIMNRWQPKITATEAGLIYCIEPVFASVMALFLPGWFSAWARFDYANETVTWHLLAGGGLITLANVWLQFTPPKPEATQSTAGRL